MESHYVQMVTLVLVIGKSFRTIQRQEEWWDIGKLRAEENDHGQNRVMKT